MSEQRHEWAPKPRFPDGQTGKAKAWRDGRGIVRSNKWAEVHWKEEILRLAAEVSALRAELSAVKGERLTLAKALEAGAIEVSREFMGKRIAEARQREAPRRKMRG